MEKEKCSSWDLPVQTVECGSATHSFHYKIKIGYGLLEKSLVASDILQMLPTVSVFVIVTDQNLYDLYGKKYLENFLRGNNQQIRVLIKVLNPGEATKCREVKADIEDWMLENRCHRDTCMIAFGGGVVGDLTGYVAATYMRGLPFVQVPTSLLACVDSSIGGKTGIDVPAGKNLLGAFHQPKCVYIDLEVLRTLPKREFINGMAEIIKAGAIKSEQFFSFLENNVDNIMQQKPRQMMSMVLQAVEIKAQVVSEDEKEGGIRAILNFGHSIGHGLEALLQPQFLHGECVAIGMVKEAEIARFRGDCTSPTVGRLLRCIKTYGLPTRVPERIVVGEVLKKMEVDKKNTGGKKRLVLLESIGRVHSHPFTVPIADDQIEFVMERGIKMIPTSPAKGCVRVPGSKSISNRVLLMAALGKGTCRITGLLHSDDTQVMINALQKLGATFDWEDHGNVLVVHGTAGSFQELEDNEELYFSNAGTALRFMTTCATLTRTKNHGAVVVVTGNQRMKERPIGALVDALMEHGCSIQYLETKGCPPLAIQPTGLRGGLITLAGQVSSQYVSSILLCAPYAKSEVTLQLLEEAPTSLPYILMTLAGMKQFGIEVKQEGLNRFVIPLGVYENPSRVQIEVDASSATYPLALAAITGGEVTVEGLGKESLQGDANFYEILQSMGCEALQTGDTTTVKAPAAGGGGRVLKAVDVNMESMTDAFMTAVAVAAVAQGTTRITGIANQRVKECNRIEVMVTELTKLGIPCGELEDGIWVKGVDDVSLLRSAYIACHNDHRIAMSFAVLGARVPGVVITDKECTDKTYPEFWEHCQTHLGLNLAPVDVHRRQLNRQGKDDRAVSAVFVIGMRGAGKSSLCEFACRALDKKLLDMDRMLEESLVGYENIKDFVAKEGWMAFRAKEVELLRSLIMNPPQHAIVSCGGGVVETPEAVALLTSYPCVVYIQKHMDDIVHYLSNEKERPAYEEEVSQVLERRIPLFEKCCTYQFLIPRKDEQYSNISDEFVRFLKVIAPLAPMSHVVKENSFFLSFTLPNVHLAKDLFPQIALGVEAIELRVDLLESQEPAFVLTQLALLRRYCDLPIIYTVRSKNQGGAFPDDAKAIFKLLELGLQAGCEFVDMECCWAPDWSHSLLQKNRNSRMIASYHAIQRPVSDAEIRQIFLDCFHNGRVDIVKVVLQAYETSDSYRIHEIAQSMKFSVPVIALCTGEKGKLSRVLNSFFTPVTHPMLGIKAAPGQLSVSEIIQLRNQLGMIPANKYYLFGHPIQHSPSPNMHNVGFDEYSLPHRYSIMETEDVQPLIQVIAQADFGGASVTTPHKVSFVSLVHELSPSALAIGALNTIVPFRRPGSQQIFLQGDNTDWIGIFRAVNRRVQKVRRKDMKQQKPPQEEEDKEEKQKQLRALVVGAGGTSMAACYAMQHMGAQVFIYNRTYSKAQDVANRFHATALKELSATTLPFIDLVVCTVPATAGFTLPDHLFLPRERNALAQLIVMDAAYKPAMTPLLEQAREKGASCIQGVEMLYEQAFEQFRLWTHLEPPRRKMAQACLASIPSDQIIHALPLEL